MDIEELSKFIDEKLVSLINKTDSKGVTSENPIEEKLLEIVAPLKIYKRIPRRVMESFILELCSVCYLSLEKMSQLLQRDPQKLRDNFITPLCRQGMLERKYPEPNHPKQEYKTSES